ncbi:ABC-2 type transport system permease protein [Propionibacterium cyclohexanicum]|uniref:ABC-2 type transport system permease protein n=1 Tax=Propionibacterium cyclohexanicum TaxID=64702 RepID=A0A1H9TQU3_9ACTN|nr:ABC transporter permease [Propionibacterium cyclohexanicum]SER99389.1 ABC-2 type transport system permease protein [Propionibacterium cyclohexanicum]
MRALIVKEFRELARDRRTLAMLVVLPVLLLVIFGYAANFSVDRVSVIVVGSEAKALADELGSYGVAVDDLEIVRIDPALGASDAERLLRDREADAVIVADGTDDADAPLPDQMRVYVDGSELFTAQAAKGVFVKLAAEDAQDRIAHAQTSLNEALATAKQAKATLETFSEELAGFQTALQQALATGGPIPAAPTPPAGLSMPDLPEISAPSLNPDEVVTVLFNLDLKTSWVMVPGLIGLILLFIGALITSIGLVRERETGTLEQLAVMPLRPSAIIIGKVAPYFLLALIDMAAVTALGVWLFEVPFAGSLWLFSIAAVVFLLVVLGIGVLISSVSQNTGQAIQMAILFVVPQVLLSGLIFPLDSMPLGVRWIGYVLPLTWFREIAQGVMLRGAGLGSLWLPLAILTAMAVVAFGASTARMRYSLTHGGAR